MYTMKAALTAAVFASMFVGSTYAQAGSATDTDTALANDVRQAIGALPSLAADQLRVQSIGGVVYLYGTVDTQMESAMAESITQRVHGVQQVVNGTDVNASGN